MVKSHDMLSSISWLNLQLVKAPPPPLLPHTPSSPPTNLSIAIPHKGSNSLLSISIHLTLIICERRSEISYSMDLGTCFLLLHWTTQNVFLFFFFLVVVFLMFLVMHVYISTLWHISSAVSVVEPVYEFTAMRKSYELLEGKIGIGFVLIFV